MKDLRNQIKLLKNWCFQNDYHVDGIYSDVPSGISFEKRTQFVQFIKDFENEMVNKMTVAENEDIGVQDLIEQDSEKFTELNNLWNLSSTTNVLPKVVKTDGIEVRGFADEMMARGPAGQPAPSPVSKTSEFIK